MTISLNINNLGVYECLADNGVDNRHGYPVIDQVYLIVDCK